MFQDKTSVFKSQPLEISINNIIYNSIKNINYLGINPLKYVQELTLKTTKYWKEKLNKG